MDNTTANDGSIDAVAASLIEMPAEKVKEEEDVNSPSVSEQSPPKTKGRLGNKLHSELHESDSGLH